MRNQLLLSLGVLAQLLAGCGVSQPVDPGDLGIVVTARDPGFNYQAATTYSMPDTVAVISDTSNPAANVSISIPASLNTAIINQIATNMQKAGFTRLTDTSGPKPSVIMEISALATTNTQAYYNYWYPTYGAYYGAWYGGTYAPGWAPYGSPYVVSTTVGSLIMNMTNPNAPNASTQQFPTVWVGVVNGILSGSSSGQVQTGVIAGINQAFAQSGYL